MVQQLHDLGFLHIASQLYSNLSIIDKWLCYIYSNRMAAADALKHSWFLDQKQDGHTLSKSKSKMKKFLARRKWQVCNQIGFFI